MVLKKGQARFLKIAGLICFRLNKASVLKSFVSMTLLAERKYATNANAIVSVGFTPAGRQLTAT